VRPWPARILRSLLLALAGLAGTAAWAQTAAPAGLVFEAPGRIASTPLFEASLVDLDNQPVKLTQRGGRPLVINFWARWCGPCKAEIPELVALQQRNSGVDVMGLNIESQAEPVRDFARAYDINYPVLLTREAGLELMRVLGNPKAGLPFTVVLNRDGAIVATRLGAATREQLDAAVQRAASQK